MCTTYSGVDRLNFNKPLLQMQILSGSWEGSWQEGQEEKCHQAEAGHRDEGHQDESHQDEGHQPKGPQQNEKDSAEAEAYRLAQASSEWLL